eukprot:456288-Prymnesium_polylepis.1
MGIGLAAKRIDRVRMVRRVFLGLTARPTAPVRGHRRQLPRVAVRVRPVDSTRRGTDPWGGEQRQHDTLPVRSGRVCSPVVLRCVLSRST